VGGRLFKSVPEPAGFYGVDPGQCQNVGEVALSGVGVAAGDHGLDLLGDRDLHRVAQQTYRFVREQGRVRDLLRSSRIPEVDVQAEPQPGGAQGGRDDDPSSGVGGVLPDATGPDMKPNSYSLSMLFLSS
jgi:hypothetical protein